MLKIIRDLLLKIVNDIDSGNTNIDYEQQCKILRILNTVNSEEVEMSKTQAADYVGVCRATFDNYVKDGFIPKGQEINGFKEKRWYKSDLDLFLINKQ